MGSHHSIQAIASFSSDTERRWWMLELKCGVIGVLPLLVVTILF
jgi:hypothetical protein